MGKSTVLVTGAGGYIGRHVVERLVGRGHEVRATDLPGVDLSYAGELGAYRPVVQG
ncbi:MAG: NAD-dependent epimerase/dehydratase family protein [Actinobacteria bacterium]|nr:NAD-dependent epimerase/dehydratase family protein [Actinomycetota bacterium]MBU4240465.1 NAD-dependent epimerase/dehydratase family protein [Actinomycetota bacterium]MBU4301801.1 NAD-dependent epimerase/dehydratase family protein [Actinomycetota bacterium]MBU4490319.1 NAD-dependent epimerase/dehydratase family protein [Actinomycetota bacterium]